MTSGPGESRSSQTIAESASPIALLLMRLRNWTDEKTALGQMNRQAADELERLQKIEAAYDALSQDDGKKDREIERMQGSLKDACERIAAYEKRLSGETTWTLERWDLTDGSELQTSAKIRNTGAWVRYEDIKHLMPAEKSVATLQTERDALCLLLGNLVRQLDVVHADSSYKSVWMTAQLHCGYYAGPDYSDQLNQARAFLETMRSTENGDDSHE